MFKKEVGCCLSEMIHFGKAGVTCKVSDPSFANFNQRRSSFLVAAGPLPIKKIQLLDGKICHYAKDYGLMQEEDPSCPVGVVHHLESR